MFPVKKIISYCSAVNSRTRSIFFLNEQQLNVHSRRGIKDIITKNTDKKLNTKK